MMVVKKSQILCNGKNFKSNQVRKDTACTAFKSNTIDKDTFLKLKNKDTDTSTEKKEFSFKEAGKNLFNGLISPITTLINHPVKSLTMLAATIGLCSVVPVLIPILTVGFGAFSLYETGKGILNVYSEYKNGNIDKAEKAFESIGSGITGVALTALGLKSSAAAAIEAKSSQACIISTDFAKNITFIAALKEHFSLFTTTEGRNAILNQLKPSSIVDRVKNLNPFKQTNNNKTTKKTKQAKKSLSDSRERKIAEFLASPEGIRRSKLKIADMKPTIEEILDKSFEKLGVPAELRPKIEIIDDLKYFSKEEIEAKISSMLKERLNTYNWNNYEEVNLKIFSQGDDPFLMSDEVLKTKINDAIRNLQEKYNTTTNLDPYELENLLKIKNEHTSGSYNEDIHTIKYYPSQYRKGLRSFEETLSHEALHASEAILRGGLNANEVAQLAKDILLNKITHGENEQILTAGIFNQTMSSPIMNQTTRTNFTEFAKENLFLDNKDFTQKLFNLNSRNNSSLAHELKPFTDKLSQFLKENPDFIANNGGNEEIALSKLIDYCASIEIRYYHFSKQRLPSEILKKIPDLTSKKREMATLSFNDIFDTIEGNAANGGLKLFGSSKSEYNQYQFSSEECKARNFAAQFEKDSLQKSLNSGSHSEEELCNINKRIEYIDEQLEFNKTGKEYYESYIKMKNNPENIQYKTDYERLEIELEQRQKRMDDFNYSTTNKTTNKTESTQEPSAIKAQINIPSTVFAANTLLISNNLFNKE